MTTLCKMNDGYGAAYFDVAIGMARAVEIQVNPAGFKVYYRRNGAHPMNDRLAVYVGADAVAVGAAVCNGDMPPAILADWCDDSTPVACDHDFRPGEILRAAK